MSRHSLRHLSLRLILACLAAAAVSQPAAAQSRTRIPSGRELNRYGLQLQWWGQAVMDPARDTVMHVSVDEDIVYVQSTEGLITAFHAETGKRLWSQLLGAANQISLPIASNEREAFVAIGLQLFSLNKFTGEIEWELRLPHHPSTAPEADSDRMYVGMVDGSVFCYNIAQIETLWIAGRLPQWSANAYRWRHKAPEEITSSPISDGRLVAFASYSGTVYSVLADEHRLNFQFETDEPIVTPMGRGAGSLFVVSEDTRLYCLNFETGVRRWTFTAGVPIRTQPQVIGSNVYVSPHNDGLYCLSTTSGAIKWHQPRATTFLAATDSYLFASDSLNNVLMLAHEDGGIQGEAPLKRFSKYLPNERTDRLFLASSDGVILCISEQGQEFPQYHKFPERRPILPELAEDEPDAEPAQ
jgi:outer membrane protein assembly factor BamB